MRPEDLDEVLAIEQASFSMPWSRGAFLYEMQQNRVARCWVGREDGRVVGYLCLWEVADELHITNVAVHPAFRRRGIARTLLGGVLDDARQRRLRLVVLGCARATTRRAGSTTPSGSGWSAAAGGTITTPARTRSSWRPASIGRAERPPRPGTRRKREGFIGRRLT